MRINWNDKFPPLNLWNFPNKMNVINAFKNSRPTKEDIKRMVESLPEEAFKEDWGKVFNTPEPVHDYEAGTWTQEDEDKLNQRIDKQIIQQKEAIATGLKYDGDKPQMDLLDAEFLEEIASVLTFGANKYAAHNWRNGISYSRLIAAAYRHLGAINRGEDFDPESGKPHTGHLGCCLQFLSWMMKHKPELDDRYKGQ